MYVDEFASHHRLLVAWQSTVIAAIPPRACMLYALVFVGAFSVGILVVDNFLSI